MAITKEIKRLEKSNVNLTITVPKDDVRVQYQNMIKEYSKNLQIPGFRKGKVPQEVMERKYGEGLKEDALSRIIEASLKEIFTDENMPRNERPLPYSAPELLGEPKLDFDNDFQFSVIYDVLPSVNINQWKGLKIEYPYAEVAEGDINRELEAVRERNAFVMDKDDNAAAVKGDIATIDYEFVDNNSKDSVSDLQRKDYVFTIGHGVNIYEFDDDITGMKKGDTKEVEKTYPEDHGEPALAGKTLKAKITLTQLKEKQLPNLDDELAQDVDEKFNTLADLKNSITDKLNKVLERRLREIKLNELLKEIMKNTPVIIPESMINSEIEGRFRRLARMYGTSAETMMNLMFEQGGEEKKKEWRETAESALHSRLIIETIMEEQKYEVSDDEIEKEYERIAIESGFPANDIEKIEEIKKNYNREMVIDEVKERKVIDTMFAENTLTKGKIENYQDYVS